jgi:formate dehydrogenase major subunit
VNAGELRRREMQAGERVDLVALSRDGIERVVRGLMLVEYALPDGCCGAYYPEANPLVPLYAYDPQSRTPSYKGVPVKIRRAGAAAQQGSLHGTL